MWPTFQLNADQKDGIASGMKLVGAWGSVGATKVIEFTAWAHAVAEVAAAIFTILLITEFVWKKVILPFCRWRGWIKPKKGEKHVDDE